MQNIQISALNHIFFVGIGGISVSSLAAMMLKKGKKVSGSDLQASPITQNLEKLGAKVYINHNENNLENDIDLLVFSGAISAQNPELLAAKKRGIAFVERSEFLAVVASTFERVIAVAGTHGKTTTTAMIGEVLVAAGKDPTIHVGGRVVSEYGNFRNGGQQWFLTEACEYRRSLLYLKPHYCVVTNIERDHMDCYANYNDLVSVFKQFAHNCKNLFSNKKLTKKHFKNLPCTKIVLGKGGFCAKKIRQHKPGKYEFDVYCGREKLGKCTLGVFGRYMVENALYAICVCTFLGLEMSVILKTLANFKGIERRNEQMGYFQGVPVYADYAHHPTQVKNAILAFNEIYDNVLVVFQPHTYSRTLSLKSEFSKCFKKAPKLIIFKTYAAREEVIKGGLASDMYNYIFYPKNKKFYANCKQELKKLLHAHVKGAGAVLVLGAGDLYDFLPKLIDLKH